MDPILFLFPLPEMACSRSRAAREVIVHGAEQSARPRTKSPSTLVHESYSLSREVWVTNGTLLPGHSVKQKVK